MSTRGSHVFTIGRVGKDEASVEAPLVSLAPLMLRCSTVCAAAQLPLIATLARERQNTAIEGDLNSLRVHTWNVDQEFESIGELGDIDRRDPLRRRAAAFGIMYVAEEPVDLVLQLRHYRPGFILGCHRNILQGLDENRQPNVRGRL